MTDARVAPRCARHARRRRLTEPVTGRVQPLTIIRCTACPRCVRRPAGPAHRRCRGRAGHAPLDRDCIVVTQKIVSKAEGRLVEVDPDDREARRVIRRGRVGRILLGGAISSSARPGHGFVCARTRARRYLSNGRRGMGGTAPGRQRPLGPPHPRRAARHAWRRRRRGHLDTFGRPWRQGLTDVAIGVAGLAAIVDLRGTDDALGRELQVTEVAVGPTRSRRRRDGDGQSGRGARSRSCRPRPLVVSRESAVTELVRPPGEDLFR